MTPIIVFITGANRGLGLGLVKGSVAKLGHVNSSFFFLLLFHCNQAQSLAPNLGYIVIAAVRNLAHLTAQEFTQLSTGEGSHVIVVKYEASIEQSAIDAVKEVTDQGISHLDIAVANAGISKLYPLVKDVKRADIVEHIDVKMLTC